MGNETKADKIIEERARAQLEQLWSVNIYPNAPYYPFDWQIFDRTDNHCLGLGEFKDCKTPLEHNLKEYGGYRAGVKKLCKGISGWLHLTSLPLFYVFKFYGSEDIYYHRFEKDRDYDFPASRFWGRRKGVPQDEEPCIIITQDEFKKAEADDLDPLGGVAY